MRGLLQPLIGLLLLLSCLTGLSACQPKPEDGVHAGKAFLDSQIPPGLSPQYYPPEGFVWGSYKSGNLPQARYGVAFPPVNPLGQVLIIADADYPAEVYFETARQLLTQGYGVWIVEPVGQGGAGRYSHQTEQLELKNFRHPVQIAEGFVRDVIAPAPERPLYVVGTGSGAVTAFRLRSEFKDAEAIDGFIGLDPFVSANTSQGEAWSRDKAINTYWGGIAHIWQMSNPDLRLRQKSEGWIKETQKAWKDLSGVRRSAVNSAAPEPAVVVMQSRFQPADQLKASSALCQQMSGCEVIVSQGPQNLGHEIAAYLTLRKGLRTP